MFQNNENGKSLFKTPEPRQGTSRQLMGVTPTPGPSTGISSSLANVRRQNLFKTPTTGSSTPRRNWTTGRSGGASTGVSTARRSEQSGTTPTSGRTIDSLDRNTILAVVEGRGQARGEIGIASINVQTPNLILCQFTDTQSYMRVISKVNIFRPHEILMPTTACDPNSPSQLCVQLKKEVPGVSIIPIQRKIFNEAKGLQKLNLLSAEQYSPVVHLITNKYYCLAAAAALLKYAELVQSIIFSSKSLKVEFQGCDQACMIDHVTAQHLELLQNSKHPSSSHSLLGILNDCRTPVGSRLLRMNILQPSCDEKLINTRLDCVEELMRERETLFGLQDILGRLPVDIEHVIASLIQIPKIDHPRVTEHRINYVIALKHTLELVPTLASLLESSVNEYFQSVREDLMSPAYEMMLEKIKRVVHDEAQYQKGAVNMKRQRCFAVKADVNPILDIARKAYCEIIDDINKYVIQLSQEMNLSLRLGTSNQRGFYIQFMLPGGREQIPDLPSHFLQVKKRGNVVTFTTEVLIASDHRAQEIMKEIENLSGIVISELITGLRADIGILFKASDGIANLDLINSLANYALTTPRTVRPTFTGDVTSVTMGRHPILDSISADPAVPNNAFISNETNFMLITGPNMSGKTTYIKQVACMQVLAQIGSFVPAEAASFRLASNILSRIGTGDSIEENSSSFALEMTEMTFILQNVCDRSLIIIDELGRATSVEEGAAISWAIAEELLKTEAFVLFATHHLFLTKLESQYINVLNFSLETREWKGKQPLEVPETNPNAGASNTTLLPLPRLQYSHVMSRGVTKVEYYGLKLAMTTAYPARVVANAMRIAERIIKSRKISEQSSDNLAVQETRNKYLLGSQLYRLATSCAQETPEVEDLQQFLEYLKMEFQTGINTSRNPSSV